MPSLSRTLFLVLLGAVAVLLADSVDAQRPDQLGQRVRPLVTMTRGAPADGATGIDLDIVAEIAFSDLIDPNTVDGQSITVTSGGASISTQRIVSLDRKRVLLSFPEFLPGSSTVTITVHGNRLRDIEGRFVDVDGSGSGGGVATINFVTNAPLPPPVVTDSALITGYVFVVDIATGETSPLSNATARAYLYPPPEVGAVPVGMATTNINGYFELTTAPFTGIETFLVSMSFLGHSEALRQVTIMAGRCYRVDDAALQQLGPPQLISAAGGGTAVDMGGAEVVFPAGAIADDTLVTVTLLASSDQLRDYLPEFVSTQGTFIDIGGLDGEITSSPVTLRIPNRYNLPVQTPPIEIPMGKVDHNTLEWSDLTELYTGPGDPPESFVGRVVSDGMGGSVIEVEFDHFCSICTSYCLPVPPPPDPGPCDAPPPPPPGPFPPGPPPGPGPPGPPPGAPVPAVIPILSPQPQGRREDLCRTARALGYSSGQSEVSLREGYLYEFVNLPSMQERGTAFNLQLAYFSGSALPSVTLSAQTDYDSTRPVERTQYEFDIEGEQVHAVYDFSENNTKHHGKYIWHGVDGTGSLMPTGSYAFDIFVSSLNANVSVSIPSIFGGGGLGPDVTEFTDIQYPGLVPQRSKLTSGRALLLNRVDSPYGAGWSIVQEERLHNDPDGCILFTNGSGDRRLFVPDTASSNRWVPMFADGSELIRNPSSGNYERRYEQGWISRFNPSGLLMAKISPFGATTTFVYSGGRLASVTSPTGHFYTLSYDGNDKLSAIADSAGRTTLFTVAGGDLTVVDGAEGVRTFGYDADHLLTEQIGVRNERSTYGYENGRVTSAISYESDGTTVLRERYFYPSALAGEAGLAIANGLGTILAPIPVAASNIDYMVDGRGTVHEHEIDGMGNTIRESNGAVETLFTYDEQRRMTSIVRSSGWQTHYDYDDKGRLTTVHERNGGTLYATITREYEGLNGRLSREVDAEGRERLYEYDASGRLTRVQDNLGDDVAFFYGSVAHPSLVTGTERGDAFVTTSYDVHGNLAMTTDALGRVTTYVHDPLTGLLSSTTTPELRTATVSYDAMNRIVASTGGPDGDIGFEYSGSVITEVGLPGGETIMMTYDGLGRRVSRVDANGEVELFEYDNEGALVSHRNRADQLTLLDRDDRGQLVSKVRPDGSVTLFDFDDFGNLTWAENSHSTIEIQRDFLGRASLVRSVLDFQGTGAPPVEHELSYTYDRTGRRLTMADANGTYSYGYDPVGRLATVSDPFTNSWTYSYDALGRLAQLIRANGVTTEYGYDVGSQLVSIEHQDGTLANLIANLYDGYDLDGLVTDETLVSGVASSSWLYDYDDRARLTNADASESFGDALVNVTSLFDSANRITSDSEYSYTHDTDGRMTVRDEVSGEASDLFEYDTDGQLTNLQQTGLVLGSPQVTLDVRYYYDPLGRRIAKEINGIRSVYLYDGERLIEELDHRDLSRRVYVHGRGNNEPLAVIDRVGGETHFYHHDRLGSVRGLTDETGGLSQLYVYDAFGSLVQELASGLYQPFGFIARERDRESGLTFMRARYYVPQLGRFLSEDPLGLLAGENFYVYSHGDPVNRRDPSGQQGVSFPKLSLGDFTLSLGEVPRPEDLPPVVPTIPHPWDDEGGLGAGGILVIYGAGGGVCGQIGIGIGLPDFSTITNTPVGRGLRITF